MLDSRRERGAGAAAPPERRAPSGAARAARELLLPRVARRLDGRRSRTAAALESFLALLLLFCSGGGTGGSSGTPTGSGSCTRLIDTRLTRMGAGRPVGDVSPEATDVLNCALTVCVTDWVRVISESLRASTSAGRSLLVGRSLVLVDRFLLASLARATRWLYAGDCGSPASAIGSSAGSTNALILEDWPLDRALA